MRQLFYLCAALWLVSCSFRYQEMNSQDFQKIATGTSISHIEAKYGEPNAIHRRGSEVIYEYVKLDYLGTEPVRQVRFLFVVEDGKVVNKYTTYRDEPAFELLQDPSPI